MIKCDKYKNEDDIDDRVEEWYNTDTKLSLQDYLGLNKEEFKAYINRRLLFG